MTKTKLVERTTVAERDADTLASDTPEDDANLLEDAADVVMGDDIGTMEDYVAKEDNSEESDDPAGGPDTDAETVEPAAAPADVGGRIGVRALLGILAIDLFTPIALAAGAALGIRGVSSSSAATTAIYVAVAVIGVLALINIVGWWLPPKASLGGLSLGVCRRPSTSVTPTRRRIARVAVATALIVAVGAMIVGNVIAASGERSRDAAIAKLRATAGTEASAIVKQLLSYKYTTIATDVAKAQERLTGQFADYYSTYTQQVVIPTARQKQVVTAAQVAGAAVTAAKRDSATVLLMVNQTTTSVDEQTPAASSSDIVVHLVKIDGVLKLDRLNPA